MGHQSNELTGPDFSGGIELSSIVDGQALLGHCGGEAVLLVRKGTECFAVGANCTHYGAPLADGAVINFSIRCPWHHAAFDLRSGEALKAPALNPIACWETTTDGRLVFVKKKKEASPVSPRSASEPIVIVGAGAAGNAAAEMLRRRGYRGRLLLIGEDEADPVDRPNLSKDYLAGKAPEEWIPLRPAEFYREQKIELRRGVRVTALDTKAKVLTLSDGTRERFGSLLLATGAEAVRLSLAGADLPHVHYLRSLSDSRKIIASVPGARKAVIIGASFIGLEVAASLRARGLEVHIVGKESRPLERILGAPVGDFIRSLHEEHGVRFHMSQSPRAITPKEVLLENDSRLAADLVVIGVGVRPSMELAEKAGLTIDRGILVDEYLQTSVPGIYAAGDVARWKQSQSGEKLRIEHWVVAERQGQVAAQNILGMKQKYDDVPFFWSNHYDVAIAYFGYGHRPIERIEISGKLSDKNCAISYWSGGKITAVATIGRERLSLRAEAAMERGDHAQLKALLCEEKS